MPVKQPSAPGPLEPLPTGHQGIREHAVHVARAVSVVIANPTPQCGGLNGWVTTQGSGCATAPNWISLIVSPDELNAMITSGSRSSSSCP